MAEIGRELGADYLMKARAPKASRAHHRQADSCARSGAGLVGIFDREPPACWGCKGN